MGSFKTDSSMYDVVAPVVRTGDFMTKYLGEKIGEIISIISIPITIPVGIIYAGFKAIEGAIVKARCSKPSNLENEVSD